MTSWWETIWAGLLIVALAAFTVMAVLVTIGGAYDLVRMLKELRDRPR